MSVPLSRPATPEGLFLWVMHRFAEAFEDHAIIKGGMALRLFDCPRSTVDIDYVFVPFRSKTEIRARLERVLREIEGAAVSVTAHSKMLRASLRVDAAAIIIEADVDLECPATPVATAVMATAQRQPSRVVRVMALDCALAHKLAAWNERRLLRDLYDCYFLTARLGEVPDMQVLDRRLARVESRLPQLKKQKHMTRAELATELRAAADALDDAAVDQQLAAVLPAAELVGLKPRIRAAVVKIAEGLEEGDAEPRG
jgi:predicted nucleotidyltransferase component of viral defense system